MGGTRPGCGVLINSANFSINATARLPAGEGEPKEGEGRDGDEKQRLFPPPGAGERRPARFASRMERRFYRPIYITPGCSHLYELRNYECRHAKRSVLSETPAARMESKTPRIIRGRGSFLRGRLPRLFSQSRGGGRYYRLFVHTVRIYSTA